MAADPEAFGLLEKVLAAGAAILGPIFGLYKWMEAKLDAKADKSDLEEFQDRVEEQRKETRENLISIFNKLGEISNAVSRIEGKCDVHTRE